MYRGRRELNGLFGEARERFNLELRSASAERHVQGGAVGGDMEVEGRYGDARDGEEGVQRGRGCKWKWCSC